MQKVDLCSASRSLGCINSCHLSTFSGKKIEEFERSQVSQKSSLRRGGVSTGFGLQSSEIPSSFEVVVASSFACTSDSAALTRSRNPRRSVTFVTSSYCRGSYSRMYFKQVRKLSFNIFDLSPAREGLFDSSKTCARTFFVALFLFCRITNFRLHNFCTDLAVERCFLFPVLRLGVLCIVSTSSFALD